MAGTRCYCYAIDMHGFRIVFCFPVALLALLVDSADVECEESENNSRG